MAGSALHQAAYAAAGLIFLLAGAASAGLATRHVVSQKGQAFRPGQLSIKRGDTVQLVNDDDDLLHHSYVESPEFSFDSGDQAPGVRLDVTFPISGTFTVMCGIHPRMKLAVRVE